MRDDGARERRKVIVAPHPRTMTEIFATEDLDRLASFADICWARDEPLPPAELTRHAAGLWTYVAARPLVDRALLEAAPALHAVIEVAGSFKHRIDYGACFDRGVRVLSCAPAFGPQVAEMALAMILGASRGLVGEHEAFRNAREIWQQDRPDWDFTLFGQSVGLIGAGSIARSLLPLLRPFGCRVRATDPWLPDSALRQMGCEPAGLEETLRKSRVVVVLAAPTSANRALLGASELAQMQPGSLLVLISRAHLVNFDALVHVLTEGHIQAAIDVFPEEPLPHDHPIRQAPNVILSAHRAASIRKERQAIGRMVVDDLEMMARDLPPVRLQAAQPELVGLYASQVPERMIEPTNQ